MLDINMEDVVGVWNQCQGYVYALAVVMTIAIIVAIASVKFRRPVAKLIRSNVMLVSVSAMLVVVNLICLGPMASLIDLAMAKASVVSEATTKQASQVAEDVAEEGFVLLKNDDAFLPMTDVSKLNLFGWASENPLYGGSGSGGINDSYDIVSLKQGLRNAGFDVNEDLSEFYAQYSADRPEMSIEKQSWTLPEPPVSSYPQELIDNAKTYSDVAVIVLSRAAGEGHNDMPMDVSKAAFESNSTEYQDYEAGEHYLQLSRTERDMVNMVCENFDNVMVVYNGANPIEFGFVEEHPQIKSLIWAAGPGNVGFNALGRILRGDVNPSGKTADTLVYDMTKAPWWNNAEKTTYSNMTDLTVDGMNAGTPTKYSPSYLNYVEGIYAGYKFYETAADEGVIDYDATVQYPFGYGLSYTTFDERMSDLRESDGVLSFDVTITNAGNVAGKDVVEIYSNPPYENGGIEKASANLLDFAKTEELKPGESQTISFKINVEDLASYDYRDAAAYVLDSGDYVISVNENSHVAVDQRTYTVDERMVYDDDNPRSSDAMAVTNQFNEANGDLDYLSREDNFANLSQATAKAVRDDMPADEAKKFHINRTFDYGTYADDSAAMPVTGAKNGLKLADLRDVDYDDERWNQLVQQMSVDEMTDLVALAGYQTTAANSVGKVRVNDADGPAAINNNFTGLGSIGFPVAVVIAQTWNKDLATQYGETMGQMAREMDVTGWYAPGVNLHRTPFGGRNYEYYSEDGTLTGIMAGRAIAGAESKGVYSFIKHFALYDGNSKLVCVWSNEQAIRENYLKAFEIGIKEGGADAVMVSWNYIGAKWAGESSNLLNTVLRDEWGFKGMVLTDYFRDDGHGFMNADEALANGVDAMLATYGTGPNIPENTHSAITVQRLQNASKNILYTVVHSWKYENGAPASSDEQWRTIVIVVDVAFGLILVGCEALAVRRYLRRCEQSVEFSVED